MTHKSIAYKNNLESFIKTLENAFVSRIIYDIDSNPTFDIRNLPFDFLYCNSVSLITEKGNFSVSTFMTSEGVYGLWTLSNAEIDQSKSHILVESTIRNITIRQGIDNLPCKMSIKFDTKNIILYSGEIYDRQDDKYDYKINDEMILAFDDEKQASIFENLTNYG
jgi:hypothetical protein